MNGDLIRMKAQRNVSRFFAYETEYKEKLARQCELNAQLDLENKEVVDADLGSKNKDSSLEESEIKENSYSDDIGGNASKVAESVAEKKSALHKSRFQQHIQNQLASGRQC